MHKATVKVFHDSKGYGFLSLDNGVEVFAHYSAIKGRVYRALKEGEQVWVSFTKHDRGNIALSVLPLIA